MVTTIALIWTLVATPLRLGVRALALIVLCRSLLNAGVEQFEGKPVSRIEFEPAQQPLSGATLLAMLSIQTGQPLQSGNLQESIQRLYSTGEYTDIAVDAVLENGEVRLRFLTTFTYFIGHIAVNGVPEPPNPGTLVTATKLQLGSEYVEHDVTQAIESLDDVLRRNGFYRSHIVPSIRRDPDTHEVIVEFDIDSGRRAKFDGVNITGTPDRSPLSIIRSTGWKPFFGLRPWRQVTEARIQSGLDGVRSWYPKHNHLLAHVTLAKLDFHEETDRVTPTLDIQAGPEVDVALTGAKLGAGRLRALLPVYAERAVDRDLLVEGQHNLIEYFRSEGYFEAEGSFGTESLAGGGQVIDYEISPGARHKLVQIQFEGNHYFDQPTLRERLSVIPATRWRYRWGRYSRQLLDRDLNSLRYLYRSNGFRDVDVTSQEIDNYRGRANDVALVIQIKEGPQWFVAKLEISGISAQDRLRLLSILQSTEGQPYSDLNVANDRDNILDFFFNDGYPNAKFEFSSTPAPEANRVNLAFKITPGQRQYVRNVVVNGLETTNPDLVKKRITLAPGDPLSQSTISDIQRRLYDLGIFAKVNAAIQNPEGDEPSKFVIYSLEEARRYSITVALGAEIARIGGGTTNLEDPAGITGFSPRVSFGVSRINFLGTGHILSLQTRVSTLEQRALLSYLSPQFLGSPKLSLQVAGLFDISKDVRTFSARREEGSIQLSRKLSKANTVQFRYAFRKVNILGTPLVQPELIPLLSQPVRVGVFSGSFIQDRRDDPTDAHKGMYNTIDLGLASEAFGSQTGFGRVIARNSTYHRLTRDVVLARSTYFGVIERYSGLSDIPLAERFFSGGADSQRAFPDNQAGPRDTVTGFPLGGKALFINNVELRFPLYGDNFGGVLFNDMGNVYSSIGNISLRWRQQNLADFDYGVQAFGFGIRYRTPIGPVRLDLSLSPNSPRFFGFQGTTDQLLFGGGRQTVQRINVFQFHFSLGQAF
jgi:outer membrane protein assembly complex protein YaeT